MLHYLKLHFSTRMVDLLYGYINQSEREHFNLKKNHIATQKEKVMTISLEGIFKGTVTLPSHNQFFQLRQKIAEMVGIGWKFLILEKLDGTLIEKSMNGMTLGQLGLIHVKVRKQDTQVERVSLIENGELVPRAKAIFTKWF